MRVRGATPLLFWLAAFSSAASAADVPRAVSPGDPSRFSRIGEACPTFSWAEVDDASDYELVVYRIRSEGRAVEPVLRRTFAGSVDSWTPAAQQCFEPGGRYAWSTRAAVREEASSWSVPSLFEVAVEPNRAELEAALEVVARYLPSGQGLARSDGTADESEPLAAAASGPRAFEASGVSRAVAATQMSVDGGVEAVSFTGDGSQLTGLDPAKMSSGVAQIDVTGSSGGLSCIGCVGSIAIGAGEVKSIDLGNGEVAGNDIDTSTVQARVSDSCASDEAVQTIGVDGSTTCESHTRIAPGEDYFSSSSSGITLVRRENRLCFLVKVLFRGLDGNDEDAWCFIGQFTESGTGVPFWYLEAQADGDASAECGMRCIRIVPNRTR